MEAAKVMPVQSENNEISTDNLQLVNKEKAIKIMRKLCKTAHIFGLLTDENGQWYTDFEGDKEDLEKLKTLIPPKRFQQIVDRVANSKLEDQVIEDTMYPNIKIAATAIKVNGKSIVNGLICGIISDASLEGFLEPPVEGFKTITTLEQFTNAIDVARIFAATTIKYKTLYLTSVAEGQKSKVSQSSMGEALKRNEAITSIVQLLESDDSIEKILSEILAGAGSYLNVSSAHVFRIVSRDTTKVDLLAEWLCEGTISIFDKTQCIDRPIILQHDKPVVYSSDALLSITERDVLLSMQIKATIIIPIFIHGQVTMYVCFNECEKERIWKVEEVRFVSDVAKIIQSILSRKIQKNSLARSYASLDAIINNVGCMIYVRDPISKEILATNRALRENFEKQYKDGTVIENFEKVEIDSILKGQVEVYNEEENCWYDMYHTNIEWVDGREVKLCAIYDVTDKKIYQKKIEQQAYTDFLTGLFNRMCCERDLARFIDDAKKDATLGALLYIDLDDFKHINDGLGHQYGDVLLKAISHNLQRINGIETTCYRMGGDEFVIIVPPDHFPKFLLIQEEIKEIFSKPWYLKDADYYCTMSMGTVTFPKEGDNVQELIKKADIAMYEAKKSGKNRVENYSDDINSTSSKRLGMEKNMRDAAAGGFKEFEVFYQPIIDIQKEGQPCTGAEALVRWNSLELGFLTPGAFIPLAEYLGLINPIGNHVLKEACKTCTGWNKAGYTNYKVNVNLSVVQLLQSDIVQIIANTISETEIDPQNLTLEVTESLAINDMERMKEILGNIKKLGVRIALDDFGTGYSSLNHIRQIPFDVIKVDQTFVKDLTEDSYSQSFIKMVAELANAIGVNICVEGIETKEQFEILEGMNVSLIQGYYFDKPMTKDAFENKYVTKRPPEKIEKKIAKGKKEIKEEVKGKKEIKEEEKAVNI